MNKFIVITTIQEPTKATLSFIEKKDWHVVVVGDLKTPHQSYENLDCTYIHPEEQEKIHKELSDKIGWNCIQRRNMGFLYVYKEGADILATVDDDNIPYDFWGEDVLVNKEIEVDIYSSNNGYFDPLSVTNNSDLWHRGYPIELVTTKNEIQHLGTEKRKVLVQADLWDGDPDIDAICRLSKMPEVKFDTSKPYASNQIGPFNSQNTFVSRDVIPYYMVLPNVGRMDDIWGSYIIQNKFPNSVIYNSASVYQERNEQDLVLNLEKEIIGYRNTLNYLNGKYAIQDDAMDAYKTYQNAFNL